MNAASVKEQIDTSALTVATKALTLIQMHMDQCDKTAALSHEERVAMREEFILLRQDMNKSLSRIHQRIDAGNQRWLRIAGAVIVALLAIIGGLISSGLPWGP